MTVSTNEVTGNMTITVDDYDLHALRDAIWDRQLKYDQILRRKAKGMYPEVTDETVRRHKEELQHTKNIAKLIGCNVL
jgi:hypothetical protein